MFQYTTVERLLEGGEVGIIWEDEVAGIHIPCAAKQLEGDFGDNTKDGAGSSKACQQLGVHTAGDLNLQPYRLVTSCYWCCYRYHHYCCCCCCCRYCFCYAFLIMLLLVLYYVSLYVC